MRGSGAGSSVKWGSPELTCRTRLDGTLAGCNPGALPERLFDFENDGLRSGKNC